MKKWDELEGKECYGILKFFFYFKKQYLDDLKSKMVKFVMQDLGFGEDLYSQNILEFINNLIKDWVNFLLSEIDSFIFFFYDFVQWFVSEEELIWFGLLDKWEVIEEFKEWFF